jgi:hypothetical protein
LPDHAALVSFAVNGYRLKELMGRIVRALAAAAGEAAAQDCCTCANQHKHRQA